MQRREERGRRRSRSPGRRETTSSNNQYGSQAATGYPMDPSHLDNNVTAEPMEVDRHRSKSPHRRRPKSSPPRTNEGSSRRPNPPPRWLADTKHFCLYHNTAHGACKNCVDFRTHCAAAEINGEDDYMSAQDYFVEQIQSWARPNHDDDEVYTLRRRLQHAEDTIVGLRLHNNRLEEENNGLLGELADYEDVNRPRKRSKKQLIPVVTPESYARDMAQREQNQYVSLPSTSSAPFPSPSATLPPRSAPLPYHDPTFPAPIIENDTDMTDGAYDAPPAMTDVHSMIPAGIPPTHVLVKVDPLNGNNRAAILIKGVPAPTMPLCLGRPGYCQDAVWVPARGLLERGGMLYMPYIKGNRAVPFKIVQERQTALRANLPLSIGWWNPFGNSTITPSATTTTALPGPSTSTTTLAAPVPQKIILPPPTTIQEVYEIVDLAWFDTNPVDQRGAAITTMKEFVKVAHQTQPKEGHHLIALDLWTDLKSVAKGEKTPTPASSTSLRRNAGPSSNLLKAVVGPPPKAPRLYTKADEYRAVMEYNITVNNTFRNVHRDVPRGIVYSEVDGRVVVDISSVRSHLRFSRICARNIPGQGTGAVSEWNRSLFLVITAALLLTPGDYERAVTANGLVIHPERRDIRFNADSVVTEHNVLSHLVDCGVTNDEAYDSVLWARQFIRSYLAHDVQPREEIRAKYESMQELVDYAPRLSIDSEVAPTMVPSILAEYRLDPEGVLVADVVGDDDALTSPPASTLSTTHHHGSADGVDLDTGDDIMRQLDSEVSTFGLTSEMDVDGSSSNTKNPPIAEDATMAEPSSSSSTVRTRSKGKSVAK